MNTLYLPRALAAGIEQAARDAFPRECCGLLEGEGRRVTDLHPAANLAATIDRFEIDPAAHFAALKAARANGRRLIGCYHSHPSGKAAPSAIDRAGATEEDFIWLIAAVAQDSVTLKAFVYRDAGFDEIGLVTGADLVTSSSKERS